MRNSTRIFYAVRRGLTTLYEMPTEVKARSFARCEARHGEVTVYRVEDHGSWSEETWIARYEVANA